MAANKRVIEELDDIDKVLLNVLQSGFPLVPRPFAEIGARLGRPEVEALARTKRLKECGIIRQISAIFDSRALGYEGTLAAMQVAPDRLDQVAALVSEQSGVSHNYARNHAYNLWFTLTLPPSTDPRKVLAELAERLGVERWLNLPALRVFKIGVRLNMIQDGEEAAPESGQAHNIGREHAAFEVDSAVVRELQKDIDLVERPFASASARLGVSVEQLMASAAALRDAGIMRRFAAVLRHRQAGFSANGMGAWIVPEERIEEVGPLMASFPEVTHCYQRPTYPDWPYSMFTMIHARTTGECEAVARQISERTGIGDYHLLYSTKEYKKVRVKYFE